MEAGCWLAEISTRRHEHSTTGTGRTRHGKTKRRRAARHTGGLRNTKGKTRISGVKTRLLLRGDEMNESRCALSTVAGRPATPPATHDLQGKNRNGRGRERTPKTTKHRIITVSFDLFTSSRLLLTKVKIFLLQRHHLYSLFFSVARFMVV